MKKQIRTFAKNKALVEERRSQIFQGAAKLFLKKGYGGTSMQELAEYLGMSKMGLYQYIGSKEDIIHLILEHSHNHERNMQQRILKEIEALSPTEALRKAMMMYIAGVDEIQDVINFANHVTPSLPKEYRDRIFEYYLLIVDLFEKIIQGGIKSGEFRAVNPKVIALNLVLVMQAWAQRRWLLKNTATLEEYIQQQIDFTLHSLKNGTVYP